MKREFLRQAIHRGLGFLSADQAPSGEFPSFASFEPAMGTCTPDSAVFPTALTLSCLEFVLDSREDQMRSKAYRFLKEEMIPPGLWRYWTDHSIWQQWRGSGESIAPDVDCTCCASFVLRRRQPEASLFSNIETILDNRNRDGLFLTWIRGTGGINDVDSVVNANVLLYLGELPETQAVVDHLNRTVIESQEAGSYHYYLDDLALYYMMSRAFFHGVRGLGKSQSRIAAKVVARLDDRHTLDDPLLIALGLCTLLNHSCERNHLSDRSLAALVQTQENDGGWAISPFYAGPEPPLPHSVWFGPRALTTGFCLEALARYV